MASASRSFVRSQWSKANAGIPDTRYKCDEGAPAAFQLKRAVICWHSPLPVLQPAPARWQLEAFACQKRFSSSQRLSSNKGLIHSSARDHHGGQDALSKGTSGVDKLLPHSQEKVPATSILNLPTCLTLARVLAVPLLVAAFYSSQPWATPPVRSGIFVIAALTDWLDGYLARKMNTISEFGAFLDPVADKLMVAAALILLCSRPDTITPGPPWLIPVPAIAIIGREITMSALREWAASQDGEVHKAVAVNNFGKWKTATQMGALTILLGLTNDLPAQVAVLGVSLLYVAAALALLSLGIYFKGMWFAFSRGGRER